MMIRLMGFEKEGRPVIPALAVTAALWELNDMISSRFVHAHPLSCHTALPSEDKQFGLNKLHHSLTASQSGKQMNGAIVRRSRAH